MNDYELGRLAEELIEKRYGDKIAEYEEEIIHKDKNIKDLKLQLMKLNDSKTYIKQEQHFNLYGGSSQVFRTSYSFDEVTDQLKAANDALTIEVKLHEKTKSRFSNMSIFGFLKWKRENRGEE